MLGFSVTLEQVSVESGLLGHGGMDIVSLLELLLDVAVGIDEAGDGWLLLVGGVVLGDLVENPHGWEGADGEVILELHNRRQHVPSMFRCSTYTKLLILLWS